MSPWSLARARSCAYENEDVVLCSGIRIGITVLCSSEGIKYNVFTLLNGLRPARWSSLSRYCSLRASRQPRSLLALRRYGDGYACVFTDLCNPSSTTLTTPNSFLNPAAPFISGDASGMILWSHVTPACVVCISERHCLIQHIISA